MESISYGFHIAGVWIWIPYPYSCNMESIVMDMDSILQYRIHSMDMESISILWIPY